MIPSKDSTSFVRPAAFFVFLTAFHLLPLPSPADEPALGENLLFNGGFEQDLTGWHPPWAREGHLSVKAIDSDTHSGKRAARLVHDGTKDWNFAWKKNRIEVRPGEVFRLSGWIRVSGEGTVSPCVTLYTPKRKLADWVYGDATVTASDGWQRFESRFAIPRGVGFIWPRIVGVGPATIVLDDLSLVRERPLPDMEKHPSTTPTTLENGLIRLEFSATDGSFSLRDKRTGRTWRQKTALPFTVLETNQTAEGIVAKMIEPETLHRFSVGWRVDPNKAEVQVTVDGTGPLPGELRYPYPFISDTSRQNDQLIMPVNEGIAYPVEDETLNPMWYHLYGGHGLCMGWYGMTAGVDGLMTIVETPNDAAVHTPRVDERLCLGPIWLSEKGNFGPTRKLRYVLFDTGGYVAMCKRYREYSKNIGLFKTLSQKRKENPNVDLLVGAVNVWCWDANPVAKCREMQDKGIDRILWSAQANPDTLRELNDLGVLTSRYDIYQDCMNPANFPKLHGNHGDWTSDQWPEGIILDKDGDWSRGWRVKGKDGKFYPCGRLCDSLAPNYARRRIAEELKTHPYRCRFIDTTTASPWAECYSPKHPMTRSDSRRFRMELLDVISREFHLVTGSETGHEAAVPYVHYFEGMLSLGPYRVPEAGRDMLRPWTDVPERVAKIPNRPPVPPPLVGTRLPRLRRRRLVLGRLQQQTPLPLGPPRPVQPPLQHPADVHVQRALMEGQPGSIRAKL